MDIIDFYDRYHYTDIDVDASIGIINIGIDTSTIARHLMTVFRLRR